MSLQPLAAAPAVIVAHAIAALLALGLGVVQLASPKGTGLHRRLGWVWSGLIAAVAVSSFWISGQQAQFGRLSWIHLLSILTLVALPLGLWRAHRHDVAGHRRTMQALFVGALVIAGLFTLAPGRIMGRVLFGG